MKEFEKWQIKGLKNYHSPSVYLGAEFGWKAALEWVLSRVQYANSDGNIIYDIKKELNN